MSDLSYELAKRRVHQYKDESEKLMQSHRNAMECRDCEDFLKQGLDALRWLCQTEAMLREADYEGLHKYSNEAREAIRNLYVAWITPCEYAERMIDVQLKRGYEPDHLKQFREACEMVRDTADRIDWHKRAKQNVDILLAAEPW